MSLPVGGPELDVSLAGVVNKGLRSDFRTVALNQRLPRRTLERTRERLDQAETTWIITCGTPIVTAYKRTSPPFGLPHTHSAAAAAELSDRRLSG
ncbi:hypothetical protein MRX96_008689 [Rhipicephalus microplus]